MKYNICLVSPDPSISHAAEQVVQELGDDLRCNVIIIDGNVKTAASHVKTYVEKGIDAIISRGGTAIALTRAYPQMPVIAIQIEATDILKAIQGIPDGTKIGFISYSEVIYQYQALAELMGVHKITFFRLFHLGDEDTVIEQYVQDARKQGIEVLIGSIHVREYAKKYNLRFVFLESGKGAILRAIREAASAILVRWQDRDEFKLISNIVDYTFTGTAVFDKRGMLQKWNPAFASMFAGEPGTDWKVRIPIIFSSSRLQKILNGSVPGGGEILRTEERDYAVTWQPVWEGDQLVRAIAFVQPVEQVQSYAQSIRKKQRGEGGLEEEDYLFRQPGGDPMVPSTFTFRFKKILREGNLPDNLNVHSLRHTNASMLIAQGVDVRTVAGLLGHAQPSTTLDIYSHAFDKNKKLAQEKLAEAMGL